MSEGKEAKLRSFRAVSVPVTVEVKHDGVTKNLSYRLGWDYNVAAEVEEQTGFNMTSGAIFGRPTAKNVRALFWATLQVHHADEFAGEDGLKLAGSMINDRNKSGIIAAYQEAYLLNQPDDVQERIRTAVAGEKPNPTTGEAAPEAKS